MYSPKPLLVVTLRDFSHSLFFVIPRGHLSTVPKGNGETNFVCEKFCGLKKNHYICNPKWCYGRVVRHWSAKPSTAVQICLAPLKIPEEIFSGDFFCARFLIFTGKCITLRCYEWDFFHIYDVNANATLSCIVSFVFDSQTEFFHGRISEYKFLN